VYAIYGAMRLTLLFGALAIVESFSFSGLPYARILPTFERTNRGSLRIVNSIAAPRTVRQTQLELLNRLIAIQTTSLILTYQKAASKMFGLSVLLVRCSEKMYPVSFQTACLETLKLMASNCMND
jgi:hypothetical protein